MSNSFASEMSSVLDYDTSSVKPQEAFDPLPAGDYHCLIEKAQVLPTKDGTGVRVSVQFRVIEPEAFAKRTVFDNLNVRNKSEKAQEIGQRQLAGLLAAIGKTGERDMATLPQCECIVKVGIKPAEGQYDAGNTVKGYKPLVSAAKPSAPPTTVAQEKNTPAFLKTNGAKPTLAK